MDNLEPKKLRLVQEGHETFTGVIGAFEFVDGVSTEEIPLFQRDRLACAFRMVEINADGSEQGAGPAERLLRDRHIAVEPTAPLARQTVAEKDAEGLAALLKGEKVPALRSAENLEAVADRMGIRGIRLIADGWNVRSKSIPVLIQMILAAQTKFVAERTDALKKQGASDEQAKALFVLSDDVADPIHPKDEAVPVPELIVKIAEAVQEAGAKIATPKEVSEIVKAAATGDMAAAVSKDA